MVLLAYAITIAATGPFVSVIGITELGLSNGAFAIFLGLVALVNVAIGVSLGIISDHVKHRKWLAVMLGFSGFVGYGAIYLLHSAWALVLFSLTFIPPGLSIYSMIFGAVKRETQHFDAEQANHISSIVRAAYSVPWIIVPGVIAWWLTAAASMLPVYLIAAMASLACAVIYLVFAPDDVVQPTVSKLSFMQSLALLFSPRILLRLTAMATLVGALLLSFTTAPLIIIGLADGTKQDVGNIYSLIPVFEIPFMLMWSWFANRYSIERALIIAAVIFAFYMLGLASVTHIWQVYALTIVNGCAASAILSLQITYLQNLIADRPGLSSGLLPMNGFISNALRAIAFAIGTSLTNYRGTMLIGAGMFLMGATMVYFLGRARSSDLP